MQFVFRFFIWKYSRIVIQKVHRFSAIIYTKFPILLFTKLYL